MKKIIFSVVALLIVSVASAQKADTIHTSRGKIVGLIREVTPDYVAYTFANESVVNKIEKNIVASISYGNGRKEKFKDSKQFSNIDDPTHWQRVEVTASEKDIAGFQKLDMITTKATGTTAFSSAFRVQTRSLNKLKMAAALLGGNVVYIHTQQAFQGNGLPTGVIINYRSQVTGSVYCSDVPDTAAFRAQLKNNKSYTLVSKIGIKLNYSSIRSFNLTNQSKLPQKFTISFPDYRVEQGLIYVSIPANLVHVGRSGSLIECRVVRFDKEKIVLTYRDGAKIYNFLLVRAGIN